MAAEFSLGLQITLNHECLRANKKQVEEEMISNLRGIDGVLIHLHTDYDQRFGKNDFTDNALHAVGFLSDMLGAVSGICIHPDLVDDFDVLRNFASLSKYIGIEVLDSSAAHGNRLDEIRNIMESYEFLEVVIDTAHIQEMESIGQPGLQKYLEIFSDRIREVHLSQAGNYYATEKMGKNL